MKRVAAYLAFGVFSLSLAQPALAVSMENSSHVLEIDQNAPIPTPKKEAQDPGYIPADTSSTPKTISGNDFLVFISYPDDTIQLPMVLTTSSNILNFGQIQPGEPLIRTHSLTLLPGSSRGYQVLSFQDHNLQADSDQIPGTSCDSGSCTPVLSDLWTNPLTYGFGYRCDDLENTACDQDFQKDFFKRFANTQADEFPASSLEEPGSKKSQAVLSYKLNIPGNQAPKGYKTTIYHIATPNL